MMTEVPWCRKGGGGGGGGGGAGEVPVAGALHNFGA